MNLNLVPHSVRNLTLVFHEHKGQCPQEQNFREHLKKNFIWLLYKSWQNWGGMSVKIWRAPSVNQLLGQVFICQSFNLNNPCHYSLLLSSFSAVAQVYR